MSGEKIKVTSRSEMLKNLRDAHTADVQRTRELVLKQKQLQQSICQVIENTPKTIPQIAAQIGRPTHEVLWFVASLKKYGVVVETGMSEDYPLYQRVKETAV
jgi:predicted transcriptional regulator